jgi:hypothetical protein
VARSWHGRSRRAGSLRSMCDGFCPYQSTRLSRYDAAF